jgi:DNA-binding IclR family transcriptional regulator
MPATYDDFPRFIVRLEEVVTMVRPSTIVNAIDERSHRSSTGDPSTTAAVTDESIPVVSGAGAGRRVLDGAFAVLEALANADRGLGLTALASASGLPKTSAYRLAEQLLALGAVHRVDHRYFVGARVGRIGQRWQPDPLLREAGQTPVHTLAVQSRATASLRILEEHRLRVICTTAPHGHAFLPNPADPESTARTATGRVLYASQASTDEAALPACWSRAEWRRLRARIRDISATVVDHQEAVVGICCVSAPVWWPDGTCAGAVTAVVQSPKPPQKLNDLVLAAAHGIGARLCLPIPRRD